MDFLSRGYNALRGDKAVQDPNEVISTLCSRLQHASLLEDRRAAVNGLRSFAKDFQTEVGSNGLTGLIAVIHHDHADIEILRAALECVNILCTPASISQQHTSPLTSPALHDKNDVAVAFTEIFVKDASNVTVLLDILEEPDFYVRFAAVQLLTTLLANKSDRVQECILTSPMGISRLTDMLGDAREIIRNEGLLLLIALTERNADIQKIVAFENAFDKLFDIISAENSLGDIIIQDCLQCLHNLLRYNVSNQNLFRESGLVGRLVGLLSFKMMDENGEVVMVSVSAEGNEWDAQSIRNVIMVLELIRILCLPNSPNTSANQNVLGQTPAIPHLIDLGLLPHIPPQIRTVALYTLADTIRGNHNNQNTLTKSSVRFQDRQYPVPAIQAIVMTALQLQISHASDVSVRAAAGYCFSSYVHHNDELKMVLVSTMSTPPPEPNPNSGDEPASTLGNMIITTLVETDYGRRDPYSVWFASTILSHLLYRNDVTKGLALNITFGEGEEEKVTFLDRIAYALMLVGRDNSVDARVVVSYLSLLSVWLYGSPNAVQTFLKESSNLSWVIEQVNQSSSIDILVQGLSAFLLSICIEFNDDSVPSFTRSSLQTIILNRIGIDVFVSRLERLKESRQFSNVKLGGVLDGEVFDGRGLPNLWFDHAFTEFFKSTYEPLIRSISSQPNAYSNRSSTRGAQQSNGPTSTLKTDNIADDMISSYKTLISEQDKELRSLRTQLKELSEKLDQETSLRLSQEHELSAQTQELTTLRQEHQTLQQDHKTLQQQHAELNQEMEDLLVCLAEQDLQCKEYRKQLRGLGQNIPESDDEEENGGV